MPNRICSGSTKRKTGAVGHQREQRIGEQSDADRARHQQRLAADPVRQRAPERNRDHHGNQADRVRPQRLRGRQPGKALGEARHPGEQRVVGDGPEDGEAEGARPERKPGDDGLIGGGLAAGLEGRRLVDVPAQIGADEQQEDAEQERHAPAPVEHRRLTERRGHDGGNGRAEQRAAGGRDLLETAVQAATVLRRPFDHEGGRGAPFAAGREPLHDAKR